MKINFILPVLTILATNLFAAPKDDQPIQLDQMTEGSEGTSLYDFDDDVVETPVVNEDPTSQPPAKEEPKVAMPAPFAEFAEQPSTGPGSNKLDAPAKDATPTPTHKEQKKKQSPQIISNQVLEQPQIEQPHIPPAASNNDKIRQLEEAQKTCMKNVDNAYAQQRMMANITREQRSKIQHEIALAQDGCLAMNSAVENINVAQATLNKWTTLGTQGLETYNTHLAAANKIINGTGGSEAN